MFDDDVLQPEFTPSEPSSSQSSWERIRECRFALADEVDRVSQDLQFNMGATLRRVANWLRGSAKYEEALAQPMVLAICLELRILDRRLQSDGAERLSERNTNISEAAASESAAAVPFTSLELQRAVRAGVRQTIGRQQATRWRFFSLLMWPILTLLSCWLLWVAASFLVFPGVEEIFQGFGIQLPKVTEFVLVSAATVRRSGGLMILVPILYVVLFLFLNHFSSRFRSDRGSWLDQKLTGKRGVLANWCWHLSLLLEWGLASRTALMVAGMCSHRGWLQQCCLDWTGAVSNPAQGVSGSGVAPVESQTSEFFSSARWKLVNHALELPNGLEKIMLLREISTYYQDQSSGFMEWLIAWFSTLLVWAAFGMVIMILIAIYSPLIRMMGAFAGPFAGGGSLW